MVGNIRASILFVITACTNGGSDGALGGSTSGSASDVGGGASEDGDADTRSSSAEDGDGDSSSAEDSGSPADDSSSSGDGCGADAADDPEPGDSEGLMPELTPNEEVLAIVDNLGDNEGADLPKVSIVFPSGVSPDAYPDFAARGPGIRDYSRKWVYARSRQRAYYAGGGHNTERWNDLWEYDLASNTWVMVLEPDPANTGRTAMHTWASFAYDQVQEKVYWMPFTFDGGGKGFSEFDAYCGNRWETNPSNEGSFTPAGAQALDYLPDRDVSIYFSAKYDNAGMWSFDANTQQWTQLLTHGEVGNLLSEENCAPYGMSSSYDEGTGELIHFSHEKIYHYDFEQNTWTHEASGPFTIRSERTALTYDVHNRVHIIHSQNQLYAYHADTKTVETLTPNGVTLDFEGETMFFYHEKLRVVVGYRDRDDTLWVYRYKKC